MDHKSKQKGHKHKQKFNEEIASEPAIDRKQLAHKPEEQSSMGRGMGWFGIILSLIALFFLPVIMGAAGVIVGFVAYRDGAKTLGVWAIVIGLIAIAVRFFAPLF
ncbi:DUF4190 domain-containing protein [Terrilactibacillus sp. BCM23-1]|uniref:DUF4190 domain-containing protein n=1 Tax=Terrilactibacillus tamarindi TaxID=2599694 RepID=A0A6N8CTZ1_9BACI|nr:DUF4190 domain-containing protein [Terrilactibacillus tamarindi]MTT33168.1 DUF4190 domain-containing protein [Terrilactibacillus tamarindi]